MPASGYSSASHPLVDPEDETIFQFGAGQAMRVLRGAERINLDDVLPGFQLTAADLFATLRID